MKFSVIMPAYNIAAFIGETLDSVRAAAQHYGQAVECLCVDDGSMDGTAEILDRYLKETNCHPSTFILRVIHQENTGVSALAKAAAIAKHKWTHMIWGMMRGDGVLSVARLSRLLAKTIDAGLIKVSDSKVDAKWVSYVPFRA